MLEELHIQSLVDVGTGDGTFPRQCIEKGIPRVAGVDFASPPCGGRITWVRAPAHDMPFLFHEFEWLTSFDTLEHLVPEELDDVLKEFRRIVSHGWFFSISYRTSHYEVMGANLHLLVQPKEWWVEKLSKFGPVMEYEEKYLWVPFR